MRLHRLAAVAAVIVTSLLLSGCNFFNDYGNLWNGGTGGAPAGFGCQGFPGENLWECNADSALGMPVPGVTPPAPGMCGVISCAKDESGAKQWAATLTGVSAGDSRLSCISLGSSITSVNSGLDTATATFNAPGAVCLGKEGQCNPCDDGQGGTLQNVGEYCNTGEGMVPVPGGYQCCAGLTCSSTDTLSGICQGTLAKCPPQAQPNWQPLTTTQLRWIAAQNNVNGCASQTGITQSRTIGVAFEAWVLTTIGVIPAPPGRNTTSFMSMERKNKTGGLPASVIPEFVGDQTMFPQSVLYEVKAVTGALTPGTSQWQILGLLDVAKSVQPVPAGLHPAVFFITTGNTTVSSGVVATYATPWGVAVWQQLVLYDANSATPSNPNLSLDTPTCLTLNLCGSSAAPVPTTPGPPVSPLTSPTTPPSTLLVPGDPDPPEVD